ncbi:MAG: protein phosphatase [Planctomycetaceae bacterium]
MHRVPPHSVWIGNAGDIRTPSTLIQIGIQAVVDVAFEEPPAVLLRKFMYCRFPLNDGGNNDPDVLKMAIQTVLGLIRSDIPTAVACSAGMSRSPTIVACAIAALNDSEPIAELKHISAVRTLEANGELWAQATEAVQQLTRPSDD